MKKNETKQVTINISTEAFDALSKIASTMNSVGWCGDDNTIATVIEEFCLGGEVDVGMVKENIVEAIDTMSGNDAYVDRSRRAELQNALNKVA